MRYADLNLLRIVCFVIGLLCIPFAVIVYFYEEVYPIWGVHPYRDYAFPLAALAIIFVAISLVIKRHRKEEGKRE